MTRFPRLPRPDASQIAGAILISSLIATYVLTLRGVGLIGG